MVTPLGPVIGTPVVVVDASQVDCADCSGLAPLLEAGERLPARGARLRLREPSPVVRRLVALTGSSQALGITTAAAQDRAHGVR